MPGFLERVASKSTVSREYRCTVQLLDDVQTMTVDFKKHDVGQVVLDYVCDMLNIVEKDYFGLRFVDANRHRYWLDTTKPILRQVKSSSIVFAFRVKFYPSEPAIVKEELTRYMVASQLKRDLLHGRLYCPQNDAATLGAYILQGDVGDYDPEEHVGNYVSQFKLFLNQTPKLEAKMAQEHEKLKGKGLTPADADLQFLKKACTLDTYGYYPYTIKDPKNGQVYMGATPCGVLVYLTHKKLHHIKWEDIQNFDYVGKDFYIYTTPEYFLENNIEESNGGHLDETDEDEKEDKKDEETEPGPAQDHPTDNSKNGKKKAALRFICPSATFCKHLWKYMLAQQTFFTKQRSNEVKPIAIRRGLLFRRSTFRYSGRVLQEIKEAPSPKRAEPSFERSHLQRQMARDERSAPWASKFHTLPRATKPEYNEPASLVSKEAPDSLVTRDSLLLDTTAQVSPGTTPVSGVSPIAANGPSSQDTTAATVDAYSGMGTSVVDGGYKQDTVTVNMKRVTSSETEETNKTVDRDSVRPQGTSTPLPSDIGKNSKEKQKNGAPPAPTVVPLYKTPTNITNESEGVDRVVNLEKTRAAATAGGAPTRRSGGVVRALAKTILAGLMFTIFLIGTIIVVMEIQDPQFRQYLNQVPGEDTFRDQYYQPARQRALELYESYSSGSQE